MRRTSGGQTRELRAVLDALPRQRQDVTIERTMRMRLPDGRTYQFSDLFLPDPEEFL